MMRMAILCEGKTEQEFVDRVLYPHFGDLNADIRAVVVETSRARGGMKHRGGSVAPDKLTKDLRRLCGSFDCVTMMFDYYGFPSKWPGIIGEPPSSAREHKRQIEEAVAKAVRHSRFVPNLILHEYEGLLFSQPEEIARACAENAGDESDLIQQLARVAAKFPSPEDINDSPETAPSKQIAKIVPSYEKVFHGSMIAKEIGLPVLRQKCSCFAAWIERLEERT